MMARFKHKVEDAFYNRLDRWLDNNDHQEIIARGDPEEYAQRNKKSKIKLVAYAGGTAVGGLLIGETDGLAQVGAIAGTVVSVFGAWNGASNLLLYGRGVDPVHTEKVRDHLDSRK